jgi:hypothetical protein
MEPCTFQQIFPFVPPDVLCRLHDLDSVPAPVAPSPAVPPQPEGSETRAGGPFPAADQGRRP